MSTGACVKPSSSHMSQAMPYWLLECEGTDLKKSLEKSLNLMFEGVSTLTVHKTLKHPLVFGERHLQNI